MNFALRKRFHINAYMLKSFLFILLLWCFQFCKSMYFQLLYKLFVNYVWKFKGTKKLCNFRNICMVVYSVCIWCFGLWCFKIFLRKNTDFYNYSLGNKIKLSYNGSSMRINISIWIVQHDVWRIHHISYSAKYGRYVLQNQMLF